MSHHLNGGLAKICPDYVILTGPRWVGLTWLRRCPETVLRTRCLAEVTAG
ncbi:hypothetical protein Hanom_Chr05g00424971 [Helianthus anomalus]